MGDFSSSCRAKIPEEWPWRVQVQGQAQPMEVRVRPESTMAALLEQLKLTDSTHEVVPQRGNRGKAPFFIGKSPLILWGFMGFQWDFMGFYRFP